MANCSWQCLISVRYTIEKWQIKRIKALSQAKRRPALRILIRSFNGTLKLTICQRICLSYCKCIMSFRDWPEVQLITFPKVATSVIFGTAMNFRLSYRPINSQLFQCEQSDIVLSHAGLLLKYSLFTNGYIFSQCDTHEQLSETTQVKWTTNSSHPGPSTIQEFSIEVEYTQFPCYTKFALFTTIYVVRVENTHSIDISAMVSPAPIGIIQRRPLSLSVRRFLNRLHCGSRSRRRMLLLAAAKGFGRSVRIAASVGGNGRAHVRPFLVTSCVDASRGYASTAGSIHGNRGEWWWLDRNRQRARGNTVRI